MVFDIYKNGKKINTIVASEAFTEKYCEDNGYTYAAFVLPDTRTQVQKREDAYNTNATLPVDGKVITVTEAARLWQYYAAEGNIEKCNTITEIIKAAKTKIREEYADE